MSLRLLLARRFLGLSRRRFRSRAETEWVAVSDGTRLATTVVHPVTPTGEQVPTLLVRSANEVHEASNPSRIGSALLAESGYRVVIQECRGRYGSEGRFTPFVAEARDGQDTIDWIAEQPWFDGRLGLLGSGYAAYTAWSALARAGDRVGALVVAFGPRDPYSRFYQGGAFALAAALHWGLAVGENSVVADRRLDLERGQQFLPVREADRVAHRTVPWFRDWVDHPRRDDYWEALTPDLPTKPPPTLLATGWYDPALGPMLADHAALRRASEESGAPQPELLVGPWATGRPGRRERLRRADRPLGVTLRATLSFLDRQLGRIGESVPAVRVFVRGADRGSGGWREAPHWPFPGVATRAFYLHGGGRAASLVGDGELDEEMPTSAEPPDRFSYDPLDPVPTLGGWLTGQGCGPADQRPVEARADVLCFTSAPLPANLEILGAVRMVLFAASGAPDTDFTAKLTVVEPNGAATNLCEGIVRCRWNDGGEEPRWLEPDVAQRLEIDLWSTACFVRAGARLRLEVSSSNFPRFDRNPNTRAQPGGCSTEDAVAAAQRVFHDADRPSHLLITVAG